MHLKRCYIFRVYSRGREVHGWIVPYHIQVRVYLSSPRLYIFSGVLGVRGKKTDYEKKGRVHVRRYIYFFFFCVCGSVYTCNRGQASGFLHANVDLCQPWTSSYFRGGPLDC